MKRQIIFLLLSCILIAVSCKKDPANKGYSFTMKVTGGALSSIQIHTDANYTVTNVPVYSWRSDGQATGGDTLSITASQSPNLISDITTTIIYTNNSVTDSVTQTGSTTATVSVVLPK